MFYFLSFGYFFVPQCGRYLLLEPENTAIWMPGGGVFCDAYDGQISGDEMPGECLVGQ